MKSFFQTVLTALTLFALPLCLIGQVPDMGVTSSFAMFTAAGAFSNDGTTVVTGDMGTNVGAFTGFPPGIVIGNIHVADVVSAQAAMDVLTAYAALDGLTCGMVIGTTLGNDQILTPNIYCMGAASSLNGNLLLDAEGDPDALFIFQIDGALSTSTFASITLINGANACNVYWQVNGAFDLGDSSFFVGTILASGAISLLEGSSLLGRGLTTAGAIDMHNNVVNIVMNPEADTIIADGPTTFCIGDSVILSGNCCGIWSTGDTTSSITVTESGIYFVTTTTACGSAISNQIIITLNPAPDCTISGVFTLCEGQTTELCASSGYAGYLWSTGETTLCITVDVSGLFSVTITDDNGCTNSCSQTVTISDLLPPDITCPANVTISCDEDTLPANTGTATATDDCDPMPGVDFVDSFTEGLCDQAYSISRTWTATDASGNTITCIQVITIEDISAPTITCPAVTSPVECGTAVIFGVATATDACDTFVGITFSDVTVAGTCPQEYSVTRTWIATDDCGNSSTCSRTIEVQDNTPPVIVCPTVTSPVECGTAVTFGAATATDACDTFVGITFSDVTVAGTCPQEYSVTRTWIATDDCGNSSTCSRTIEVQDNTPPVIVCPTVISPVECGTAVTFGNATATDACDTFVGITFSDVTVAGTCPQEYSVTRTWVATDDCGNSSTCSRTIQVQDTTPPVITFPEPLPQQSGDTILIQCYGQDPLWDIPTFDEGSILATDNCTEDVILTYDISLEDEGDCTADGYINLYILTWTATDECGNSSSAHLYMALVDTIAPVIVGVPDDITLNCEDIPEPPPVYATDECLCACIVFYQETERDLSACQNGLVIIRTWTAKDDCGNMTIDTQRITVIDEESPLLIIIHPELNEYSDGSVLEYTCNEGGIPSFFDLLDENDVFSTGVCDSSSIVTFTENSIIQTNCDYFGYLEQRVYKWVAADPCGNTTVLTIAVRLIDNEAPVISDLPEMVCIGDPILDNIEVSDNCDANVSLRYWDVNIPNPCGDGPARRRTYEAYDACGNVAVDTVILLPLTIQNEVQIVFGNAELIDSGLVMRMNCEAIGERYTTFSVDDVRVEGVCVAGTTIEFTETLLSTSDCIPGGSMATVELRWTATEICGGITERVIIAEIMDETGPEFFGFIPVVSITCDDTIPGVYVTDNCGEVFMTYTDTIYQGLCVYEYDIVRLITATDRCGNVTTNRQLIHVGNEGGPVIYGVEDYICDDLSIPEVTAYDACADQFVAVTMRQDTLDNDCRDGLVIVRTWSATDLCGRVTVVQQTIVINDLTPPDIFVPSYSVIHYFIDQPFGNIVYHSQVLLLDRLNALDADDVYVTDDCDLVIIPVLTVDTLFAEDCLDQGYAERRIYTWTATDICGNTATLSFTIDMVDEMAPVFMEVIYDTLIICAPLPPAPIMFFADSLETVTIVYTETHEAGPGEGQITVVRSWIATDICQNVSTYVQHIIWQQESTLECTIFFPEAVECNSHGIVIRSGLTGPYLYEWEVVGEKCFIQGGQGTPEILIYMGWSDVKIVLTVTDTFGCVSMCMVFLECVDGTIVLLSNPFEDIHQVTSDGQKVYQPLDANHELFDDLDRLSFWPNPADDVINIVFESEIDSRVNFLFTDFLGKVVQNESMIVQKGYNVRQMDASGLANGSYLIHIRSEKAQFTRGVIILHLE